MHIKLALILTLAIGARSDCLPSAVLTDLGFTPTTTPIKTDPTICKTSYTSFGRCVEEKQVTAKAKKIEYGITRGIIRVIGNSLKLLDNINARAANITARAKKAGTTTTARLLQTTDDTDFSKPPTAETGGSAGTATYTPKGAGKGTKKDPKNMNLKTETVAKLEALNKLITDNKAVIEKFKNADARKACFEAIFKVQVGSLCILTSGSATTYATVSGNKVTSVKVNPTDAQAVTTACLQIFYPVCALIKSKDAFKALNNNGVSTNTPNDHAGLRNFCGLLDASPTCVQTPSSCSAEIQSTLLKELVRGGNGKFKGADIDLQDVSDEVDNADASLPATARRLQTASGDTEFTFETSSTAPSATNEANQSNIPVASVESNLGSEAATNTGNTGGVSRLVTVLLFGLAALLL